MSSFICGTVKEKKIRALGPVVDFWEAKTDPGTFDDQERQISGRQVLSVTAVLSVSVQRVVVVDCGKPSVVAIFLLPLPAASIFSMACSSCAEGPCRTQHACGHCKVDNLLFYHKMYGG